MLDVGRDKPELRGPEPAVRGVCAVIVTYRPWPQVEANIAAVRAQAARTIVVDNEASAGSRALLAPLAGKPDVELVFNEDNRGVAAALNQAAERALARGFDWLATFDQDSRAPAGLIATLLAGGAAYADGERVAILAPLYRDRGLGFVYSPSVNLGGEPARDAPVSVSTTSGSLVRLDAWRELGGFREDLFIDCVDFEFCLRCRQRGWVVLEVRRAVIEHAQGRWQQRRFLWRRTLVNDYDAVRRYYQARNRLVMYARFATFDPRWIWRDVRSFFREVVKLLLYGEERPAKLRATLRGIAHAIAGRRGRLDSPAGEAARRERAASDLPLSRPR